MACDMLIETESYTSTYSIINAGGGWTVTNNVKSDKCIVRARGPFCHQHIKSITIVTLTVSDTKTLLTVGS